MESLFEYLMWNQKTSHSVCTVCGDGKKGKKIININCV